MAGMTKNRIGTQRGEIISEGAFLFHMSNFSRDFFSSNFKLL